MSTISNAGSSSGVSQVNTTWEPEPYVPPPPPPPPPPEEPRDAFVAAAPRKGPDLLGLGYGTTASATSTATSVSSTQAVGDSASTVNVAEAWSLLTQGYSQAKTLTGAANAALQKAAGNPALQAKLIDLLQATPASTLEDALVKDFAHGVKEAVPNPPPRPPGITSVGTLRVANSALETVAKQGSAATMKPALEAAANRGHLLPADRDVLVSVVGNPAVDAKLDSAVAEVHAAELAYTAALAERDALEQRLAGDIASFGPYLTDTQQRAYIEQFRKLHGPDYARFETKAKTLEDALARNALKLEQALRGPDGSEHARSIQAAYTALAQSKGAGEALKWAAKMEAPGSAFAPFMESLPLDTLREKAVSGALVSFYEKFPQATPTQAVDHVQKLLTDGYLLQQLGGAKVDVNVNNLPQAMRTGLSGLRELAAGRTQAGLNTLKGLESGSSHWGGAFAAAGIVLGFLQTNQSEKAQDALGTLWAKTFTGQQVASFTSAALNAANKSGGALVAARVAGGLGAFGAALDLIVQGKEIAAGQGNAGTGLSIAGDVMGLVGGALVAAGATGVGAPLAAVGAAVYIMGELVSLSILSRQEYEAAEQLRAEQRTLLSRAGADAEQVTNLERYSSPEQVESLVKSTGWTRDQVLSLGKTFPDFFAGAASTLPQLDTVANDFGLTPDQRYKMLLAIGETGGRPKGSAHALNKFAEAVRNYPKNTVGITMPQGLSKKDQWIHFLREMGNRTGSYDGLGPRNAAIFLERMKR
ncbi:hypothetical protein JYK02_33745 [Corallococcus macrosporus]|uniref:Annexin n=1 Tax=Corallococcus macrosporus TaxID=35 RepID=A0ABS3DMF6_9BACT|nr:hypothetical protein [Corallococcus macrosporus]MBN8232491.1 hypothetical protein [Corallococcus macrosporus]